MVNKGENYSGDCSEVGYGSFLYPCRTKLKFEIKKITDRLKEGGLDTLLSGVKNLLPANKLLRVTRLLEALMDPASASTSALQETDDYLFLDPRAPRQPSAPGSVGGATQKGKRMAFSEAIMFVVGGAGYVEYGNATEWANKAGKRIAYGGTEIIDPRGFIGILQSLGSQG